MNLEPNVVHHLDCFDLMARLPDASVDAIITDMPYGTTACSWDTVVDLPTWWAAVKRVLKPRGAFVTTASQPFTSALVMSNPTWFHQELIWRKQHPKGFFDARRKHFDSHETVLVFCDGLPTFNPQGLEPVHIVSSRKNKGGNGVYGKVGDDLYIQEEGNFPRSVLEFDAITHGHVHPTQKPVALYEYLIRTYTQPGELVLDPFCGSGTTAIAALNTDRRFIVGDFTREYVDITERRIANWKREGDIEVADGVKQLGLFA